MKPLKLKYRAKTNESFCNIIEKGKCCFKPIDKEGLCTYHYDLIGLLKVRQKDDSKSFLIDYQVNTAAPLDVCRVIERSINSNGEESYSACKNESHRNGICQEHYQILQLLDCLDDFAVMNTHDSL